MSLHSLFFDPRAPRAIRAAVYLLLITTALEWVLLLYSAWFDSESAPGVWRGFFGPTVHCAGPVFLAYLLGRMYVVVYWFYVLCSYLMLFFAGLGLAVSLILRVGGDSSWRVLDPGLVPIVGVWVTTLVLLSSKQSREAIKRQGKLV